MIALEFQGLVEARQGSGVYVTAATPVPEEAPELEVNALEWTEARRLFEGEACALSAAVATQDQLTSLDRLVDEMAATASAEEIERLEREFHLSVALATGNAAMVAASAELWTLCEQSPSCLEMLHRARSAIGDIVVEHRQMVTALRNRDPAAARHAIHTYLARVMDTLLTVAEADALQETRQNMAERRRALVRRNEI
jgi:DNA-binding FadR family transcriptional regulator